MKWKSYFKNFFNRCYPEKVLESTIEKLCEVNRDALLKPKSNLLIKCLSIHNPEILCKYEIKLTVGNISCNQKSYLVLPFYRCIGQMSKIVKNELVEEINKSKHNKYKNVLNVNDLCVSYKKINSLSQFVN
jgi:hypothetical protein